jgi:hypothetical protein
VFHFFPIRSRDHVTMNGRVGCPLRGGDVDLDVCLACDSLFDIERMQGHAIVRCEPARSNFDPELYAG